MTVSGTDDVPPLPDTARVVNIGLSLFADAVARQGFEVTNIDWRIPAGGDPDVVAALARLYGPKAAVVDAANAEVLRRLDVGAPKATGVRPAADVVPGVEGTMLLHCGPPIDYADAIDPLRRSMRAAVVAEGWAPDVAAADRLLAGGRVALEPANRHDGCVPMVTAIGPSQPVWVVENAAGGNRAFAPLNQGPGDTAWFGRDTPAAIERLRFLAAVAAPLLDDALASHGPIDVMSIAAQGLHMGDDVHIRLQGSTNLMLRDLLPHLAALEDPRRIDLAHFLAGNHLFFLNLAMAAGRALTGWAMDVPHSSIVTTMTRNGTEFGVGLAGSASWHLAASPAVGQALYYADYGPESAAPDVGDSAVLELVGLGAAAAAGSPAVAAFVGGAMADARATTEELDLVCAGRSTRLRMPVLDLRGTPLGVDARRVVELGITPKITTGVLHASAGLGQIGAGVAEAPTACFVDAVMALDRTFA
ncbi:MAG TPA: DUF1116 domain-containing protein [Acidimicrobiales bacterium]|nr:DUF1116 domain-containing protein [Acidimicrobiales bacterium]